MHRDKYVLCSQGREEFKFNVDKAVNTFDATAYDATIAYLANSIEPTLRDTFKFARGKTLT